MSFEKLDLSIMGAFNFACEHGVLARETLARGQPFRGARSHAAISAAYSQMAIGLLLTRICDQLTLLRCALLDLDVPLDELFGAPVPGDDEPDNGQVDVTIGEP